MEEPRGPEYTTTVSIPLWVREWTKKRDAKLRSVIMAGVRYLDGAPDRAMLEENLRLARSDIARLARYRDMVNYVFKHYPEAYDAARRHVHEEGI